MLDLVPVGARQQQAPMRLVRRGGPHLLAVDHPLVAALVGARDGARHVGAAARLAEQLAPGVLAGEDALEELLLMEIGAVRQDRRGGEGADAGLGDADRAHLGELLVDDGVELHRQVAAVPLLGPMRRAPARLAQLLAPFDEAEIGIPVGLQPGADFAADALFGRFGGVSWSCPSLRPQFAQACIIFSRCSLASPNRISLDLARLNQRWVSLSQVKPMPPCICTAWIGGLQVGLGGRGLGERGQRRHVVVALVERRRGVVGRRLRQLDVGQHVGRLVLGGLERGDRAAELHAHLDVVERVLAQPVGAADHLVGEADQRLLHGLGQGCGARALLARAAAPRPT